MKNIFLTLTGYQFTWIFCVFGEYYNYPLLGIVVGILYLSSFFILLNLKFEH